VIRSVLILGSIVAVVAAGCGSPTTSAVPSAMTSDAPSAVASVAPSPTAAVAVVPSSAAASPSTEVKPGERWIAFNGDMVRAARPDGTGDHALFPMVPGGSQVHPDWSPDGRRLLFTVRGATDEIWVGDADGRNTMKLVACESPCAWADEPAWSPDGRTIVYHRSVDEDGTAVSTIETLDLAAGVTRVIATAAKGRGFFAPRWSPDGSKIVAEYVGKSGTGIDADVVGNALVVIDLTSTKPRPHEITKVDDRCNNPDWSWTLDLILCAKPVAQTGYDGPSDLYTVHPDGTGLTALTTIGAEGKVAIMASWLPDGSGAIFNDDGQNLYIAATDGSGISPAIDGGRIRGFHPRVRPTP
jgi:Tol biopolymer transport system component